MMSDNNLIGMRLAFGKYKEGVNYKTVDYAINEIDSLRKQLQSAKAEIDDLKKYIRDQRNDFIIKHQIIVKQNEYLLNNIARVNMLKPNILVVDKDSTIANSLKDKA